MKAGSYEHSYELSDCEAGSYLTDPHEGFCCTVPFMNKVKVQLCTNVCVLVRIISVRFDIKMLYLNQLVLHCFLSLQIVMWNM